MRGRPWAVAWLWSLGMLGAPGALGGVEGVEGRPGHHQEIRAARVREAIRVDGRLDEMGWTAAPVFDAFVQRFPEVGAAPTERTELRVLYDDRYLYVGIVCHDSEPRLISRQLGRRDSDPASDDVQVLIDGLHDHRTAYQFSVNAGGVQTDGLWFDDRNFTRDWDGVWDGAAAPAADGWVAELAIPFAQIHFPEAEVQTWGFSVRRNILRKHEEIETVLNPRSSNAVVSRLGHLTGMEGLRSRSSLELLPYLSARGVIRPQFAIDALELPLPSPRILDPTLDLGLDLKSQLSSNLSLVGTINPDFGQVEADQIILNLSTFETFFPEKRPFFTQGMELFQPVGGDPGEVPFAAFYSRRIGLDGAPILGAAKATGALGKVQLAVLDALTVGSAVEHIDENAPDRRYRLRVEQPLHLAPNDSLPIVVPPPTNFFAGVARVEVSRGSRIGLIATSAVPMVPACSFDQYNQDPITQHPAVDASGNPIPSRVYHRLRPSSCYGRSGHALGMDFDLNTDDAVYSAQGQVVASMVGRGIERRVLRDGLDLRKGDLGLGAHVRAGKLGGNGFRWDLGWEYTSPRLDLNTTGFIRTQNYHMPRLGLRYHRPDGWGPLKEVFANINTGFRWTTDGRGLSRGGFVNVNAGTMLPSFDLVGMEMGLEGYGWNVREIARTGVPLELQGAKYVVAFWATSSERILSSDGFFALGYHDRAGASSPTVGWGGGLNFNLRPHPAVDTRLEVGTDRSPMAARWVDYDFDPSRPGAPPITDDTFYFADLEANFLSLTLRQSVVLSPRLSLQAYAQLFSAYGVYGPFFEARPDQARTPLRFSDLRPSSRPDFYSFYETRLNLNVVLRWEYGLGSTLFAVYTRHQLGASQPGGPAASRTVLPVDLFGGLATDSFMLKWSYFWTA